MSDSEHLARRSSVGSHSSAAASSHDQRLRPNPDPLSSVWIRRLHLNPSPPPPLPPRPPSLPISARPHQHAVSSDESRAPPPLSAGFGPLRWSPRPSRGAPAGAWGTAAVAGVSSAGGSGVCGPPMLSPFFRLPAPPPLMPVTDIGDTAPVRPPIGLGSGSGSSSSGYPGLSSTMVGGGDPQASWLAERAAGTTFPSHAWDIVPISTPNDTHDRQHGVMPQNFARQDPSASRQHEEPFSYWNMGRFQRNTTTSSIPPITVGPGNKRNADSTGFLPLKFRKIGGAI